MRHASDDVLAAIALGDDDIDAAVREHVRDCPACSLEVAELAHVHDLLREESGMPGAHPELPAQLWGKILAATDDTGSPADRGAGNPVGAVAGHTAGTAAGNVVDLDTLRERSTSAGRHQAPPTRRRAGWLIAAAAACVLAGALLGRALWSGNETSSQVVATTALTTLDASKQREGTAELVESRGTQELRVDATTMPSLLSGASGYIEVWLINADEKRMVSLGIMSSQQAVFPVPADAIAQGYRIVDLSREQFDDRPQHSGDSIMRGTLPA